MPLTPFHLGPALLVGLLLFRHLDLPTFLIASVVADVRTALAFFGVLDGPLHGLPSSVPGGAVVAALLAAVAYALRPSLDPLLELLRVPQDRSAARGAAAALGGVRLHVLLDAVDHADVAPFAPFDAANPLFGLTAGSVLYPG